MISEMQLNYVMQLMERICSAECESIQVRREATSRFNQAAKEAMKGTVWVTGCKSCYLDKHGNPTLAVDV